MTGPHAHTHTHTLCNASARLSTKMSRVDWRPPCIILHFSQRWNDTIAPFHSTRLKKQEKEDDIRRGLQSPCPTTSAFRLPPPPTSIHTSQSYLEHILNTLPIIIHTIKTPPWLQSKSSKSSTFSICRPPDDGQGGPPLGPRTQTASTAKWQSAPEGMATALSPMAPG